MNRMSHTSCLPNFIVLMTGKTTDEGMNGKFRNEFDQTRDAEVEVLHHAIKNPYVMLPFLR